MNLDQISVASPCTADWNEMSGNDQVRFCGLCQLNVYNLSGMSREEAESLVRQNEGKLCVRLFRREDGTLLTRDCPVGLQALHRRRLKKLGNLAAAVTLITALGVFTAKSYAGHPAQPNPDRLFMGEMTAPPHPQPQPDPNAVQPCPTDQQPTQPSPDDPTAHPAPKQSGEWTRVEMGRMKRPD